MKPVNKYQLLLDSISETNDVNVYQPDDSILIVDSLNTFIRNFTIINTINPLGHHIGGLVGFMKSIGYIIKMIKPTKVILVFDGIGSSNTKKNLYPDYKGNRNSSKIMNYKLFSTKEEENIESNNQMERLLCYLKVLPVNMVCIDSIEADDVMGYLINKYENNPNTNRITVMSADQDFLQLVSEKTSIYSPSKKILYNPKSFKDEYNVEPYNYIIYKTLLGDKGDNIPHIKGFGKDKLFKILPSIKDSKLLTLEEVFKQIDIENKWGSKLMSIKNQLLINYELIDLKNTNISKSNIEQIENSINIKCKMDKYKFLSMYYGDKLGNSIPNVEVWVNEVFTYLNSI